MLPDCSCCLHDKDAVCPRSVKALLFTAPDSHAAYLFGFRVTSKMVKISSANFYNLLTFSTASAGFNMRVSHCHSSQPLHNIKLWLIVFFYLLFNYSGKSESLTLYLLDGQASYRICCLDFAGEQNLRDLSYLQVLWKITSYINSAANTFGATSRPFRPYPRCHQSSCHYPMQPTISFEWCT